MKAQFVNENIRFERGQDPKRTMGIGDWSIKRALLDQKDLQPGSMEYDAQKDWWDNGGIPDEFKKEIGYSGDPNEIVGFDLDYYVENELPESIDYDDFKNTFTDLDIVKRLPNKNGWETFIWRKGKLDDGSPAYYYVDGMGTGFLSRKEWLK